MVKTFGPPTINTHGEVGDVYVDYETGIVYRCVEVIPDIDVNKYQFVTVGEQGPDAQYIWEQEMVMNCNYKAQLEAGTAEFALGSLFGTGTRVVIPEGYTAIGMCNGFPNVTSVHIPSTVTAINMPGFMGSGALKSITIPNNVKTIFFDAENPQNGPFSGCTALEEIIIDAEEGAIEGAPWGAPGTPSGPVKVTWLR